MISASDDDIDDDAKLRAARLKLAPLPARCTVCKGPTGKSYFLRDLLMLFYNRMISIDIISDGEIVEPRANAQFLFRCASLSRPTLTDTFADTLAHLSWPVGRYTINWGASDDDTRTAWIPMATWPSTAHLQLFASALLADSRPTHLHIPLVGNWSQWEPWLTSMHAKHTDVQWSLFVPTPTLAVVHAIDDWSQTHEVPMQVLVPPGDAYILTAPVGIHVRLDTDDPRFECYWRRAGTSETCRSHKPDKWLVRGYSDGTLTFTSQTKYARFGDPARNVAFEFVRYQPDQYLWSGDVEGRITAWKWTGATFVVSATAQFSAPIAKLVVLGLTAQGIVVRNGTDTMLVSGTPKHAPILWTVGHVTESPAVHALWVSIGDHPAMLIVNNRVFVPKDVSDIVLRSL